MTSNLVGLLDRIHAIHVEIATVNANLTLTPKRYYPNDLDSLPLPVVCPVVPSGQHDTTTFGIDELHSAWSIPILLFVDHWVQGTSPADAQANCEACIDHMLTEYVKRSRLDLLADNDDLNQSKGPFDCTLPGALLTANSTIETRGTMATVRFTLTVETSNDFERI